MHIAMPADLEHRFTPDRCADAGEGRSAPGAAKLRRAQEQAAQPKSAAAVGTPARCTPAFPLNPAAGLCAASPYSVSATGSPTYGIRLS